MQFLKKNLLMIVFVIVLIGVGAYYVNKGSQAVITTSAAPGSATEATFLGFATELDTVSFNTSIFSDARFMALEDIHTSVVNELTGRRDPFGQLTGLSSAP